MGWDMDRLPACIGALFLIVGKQDCRSAMSAKAHACLCRDAGI
jgi:hypothetical protein